ncbi:MAG: DUF2383 domain-containing protein [Syntrophobacteraceae bacterium]
MTSMNNMEIADALSDLVQLDVNAAKAYSQAIENIEVISLRQQFAKFRDIHNQHASSLNKIIKALDVVPPERSQDFRGFLMESWAAIRGGSGVEGALKAMRTNAEYVDRKYREASALPLTPSIHAMVEHNYRNVHAQLEFIEKALINRIWEQRVA